MVCAPRKEMDFNNVTSLSKPNSSVLWWSGQRDVLSLTLEMLLPSLSPVIKTKSFTSLFLRGQFFVIKIKNRTQNMFKLECSLKLCEFNRAGYEIASAL